MRRSPLPNATALPAGLLRILAASLGAAFAFLVALVLPAGATTNHTITVDAVLSDWATDEVFKTFNSTDVRITWDASNLYFAWNKGSALVDSDVFFVYFDCRAGGTTTSANWGSGTDTLPFAADTYIAFQGNAGETYDIFRESGGGWAWVQGDPGAKAQDRPNGIAEVSLPKTFLGNAASCGLVVFLMNNDNDYVYGGSPTANPHGSPPQHFPAYLSFGFASGVSPNDPPYFVSSYTWQAPAPSIPSFSPVMDGVKDPGWGDTPSATSPLYQHPVPGEGDAGGIVPSEGMARDVYVTNDAKWLYIGWEAFGDPFDLEVDKTRRAAEYGFGITDTSSWGAPEDPWRATTRWVGYAPNVWVNAYVAFGATGFGGMTRYVATDGLNWDRGTGMTAGRDFGTLLDDGVGWGEMRIPLSVLGVGVGETIAIVHTARHSSAKPGISDMTPFDTSPATSNWGDQNATIAARDTAVLVYVIKAGVIDAMHVPETTPVPGKGTMRSPDTVTSSDRARLRVRIRPSGAMNSGRVVYSTDGFASSETVSLAFAFASGGDDYYEATIPSFGRDSTVAYYFALVSDLTTTYVYGTDTQSFTTSVEATARANAFSYTVANSPPSAPTSVDVSPAVAADADTLTATASGASDVDGDPVTYRFDWYRNGAFLVTTFDATSPFTSSIPPDSTALGDSFRVEVSAGDGTETSSPAQGPYAVLPAFGWRGEFPDTPNHVAVDADEWILRDKEGDAASPWFYQEADLLEARLRADTDYLYFLFRLAPFSSVDQPLLAVTFDTDGLPASGQTFVADDAGVSLDSKLSTPPAAWERQVIFHSVQSGYFTAELHDGTSWTAPADSIVRIDKVTGVIEARLRRSDLLLQGAARPRITVSLYANQVGFANASDVTRNAGGSHDAYDAASLPTDEANDSSYALSAFEEDLADAALDLWFQVPLTDTTSLTNTPPPAPAGLSPASGETVSTTTPTFSWNPVADPDAGDAVEQYLLEVAEAGSNLVAIRVVVTDTDYTPAAPLEDSTFYVFRVRGRDRTGEYGTPAVSDFFVDVTPAIAISAPRDDQNVNNYGEVNGIESRDTSVKWTWAAGVHSLGYAIDSYVIEIASDTAFASDYFADTVDGSVRSYTYGGTTRGKTFYARLRGIDTGGFVGNPSPPSDGIYVDLRTLDADSSDWRPDTGYPKATPFFVVDQGLFADSASDQRTDSPGNVQRDLRDFLVASDSYNLYLLAEYPAPATNLILQVAVSADNSSDVRVFEGRGVIPEDSYTSLQAAWEYLIRIRRGSNDVYTVTPTFSYRLVAGGYTDATGASPTFLEVGVPYAKLGGAERYKGKTVRLTVASFNENGSGGVAQIGGSNSNVEDAVTTAGPNTWDEVSDRVVNYALLVTFDDSGFVSAFSGETLPSGLPPEKADAAGTPDPSNRDFILYNVFTDRFENGRTDNEPLDVNMTGGDFAGLIDKLDYLRETLAVNAIYLSPSLEFGGGVWGYNQNDVYKVQSSFVKPNAPRNGFQDLTDLIKEARRRNMWVFTDWVPGQVYQGRTVTNHPEMFSGKRFGGESVQEGSVEARQFFADHTRFLYGIGVRGFRVDNPKFYDPFDFSPDALPFWRYWRDAVDPFAPGFWAFGEVPGGASTVGSFCRDGNRLHGMLDFPLRGDLYGWGQGGASENLTGAIASEEAEYQGAVKPIMASFLENHDHDRTYHNMGGGDDNDGAKNADVAANIQVATLFMATHSSNPVLFYGDEFPISGKKNTTYPFPGSYTDNTGLFGNTREVNWSDNQFTWLKSAYEDFFSARQIFSALRTSNATRYYQLASGNRLVVSRWTGEAGTQEKVVVAMNNGNAADTYDIPTGEGGGVMFENWLSPGTQATTNALGNLAGQSVPSNYGQIWVKGGFGLHTLVVNAGEPGVVVSVDDIAYWTRVTGDDGKCTIPNVVTWDAASVTRTLTWWKKGYAISSRTVTLAPDATTETTVTLVPDATPPSVPTGLTALGRDRAVQLRWNENTENDFESYLLYRSTSPGDPNPTLVAELMNPTFYDNDYDNFLTNGTTYYYKVKACDRNGNCSNFSDEVSAVPGTIKVRFYLDVEGAAPDATYRIAGNHESLGDWSPVSMTKVADDYWMIEVSLDPTSRPEYKYNVLTGSGSAVWENDFSNAFFTVNRLVTVEDNTGEGIQIITNRWNQSGDAAPRKVRGVTASAGETTIAVGWQVSPEPDLDHYAVERDTGGGVWTRVATVDPSQIRFVDTDVASGVTYCYRVLAADWAGQEGPASDSACAVLVANDTTPPDTPAGLTVAPAGLSSVTLSWTANTEGDLAGYHVYRDTDPTVPTTAENRRTATLVLPSLSPSFTDGGLTPGVTYYYRVTAQDDSGNVSPPSDTVTATLVHAVFRVDMGNIGPSSVSAFGSPATLTTAGRSLTREGATTVWSETVGLLAGVAITYRYRYDGTVTEDDFPTASREREWTPTTQAVQRRDDDWEEDPAGPSDPLTGYPGDRRAYLSWGPDSTTEDIEGYIVERADSSGVFVRITASPITRRYYTDTGLVNGETYWYIIRSVDGGAVTLESKAVRMVVVTPEEPIWIRFRVEAPVDRRRRAG